MTNQPDRKNELTNELTEAIELVARTTRRLNTITKSSKTAHFCSGCLKALAVPPGTEESPCCHTYILDRSAAIDYLKNRLVERQQLRDSIQSSLNALKAAKPEPQEQVLVIIGSDQAPLPFPNAKAARRWLRHHGRTVTDATKEGSTWTFEK